MVPFLKNITILYYKFYAEKKLFFSVIYYTQGKRSLDTILFNYNNILRKAGEQVCVNIN